MKIQLSDGRVVIVGVQYGYEQPVLERPVKVPGRFRSVRINLTVMKDGQEIGSVHGVSYCNPADQFKRRTGRSYALKNLLRRDAYKLLSKEDRKIICPVVVYGYPVNPQTVGDKQ